jgi:hypothetical protein
MYMHAEFNPSRARTFSGLHRTLVFLNLNWHLVEWLFSPVTFEVFYLCSEHNSCPYLCLSVSHHISILYHNIFWQCKYSSCMLFGSGIFFITTEPDFFSAKIKISKRTVYICKSDMYILSYNLDYHCK